MPDWIDQPLLSGAIQQRADSAGNIMGGPGISDASTVIDPRLAEWVQIGVFNGAFERGPQDAANNIETDSNPLPDWSGPTQVSGGAITCSWVNDSSGTAKNLRFTLNPGAAGDEAYMEQIVPVPHSSAITSAPFAIAYAPTALIGTALNAQVILTSQFLQADQTTTTGAAATYSYGASPPTFTQIDARTGDVLNLGTYPNTTGVVPLDAAFVRIRIGIKRNTAAATDTGSVDITDCRIQRGDIQALLTDSADSATYGYGSVFQASGTIWVVPANVTHTSPYIQVAAATGDINLVQIGAVNVQEVAAPGTPSAGKYSIYAKTDGKLYGKNDAGTELALGGGALTDHTHAVTGSGATGGGATVNPVTLNVSGTATLAGAIVQSGVIAPTINANQNDYGPAGFATSSIMAIIVSGATRTITGFDSTGWVEGQTLIIQVRTNDLVLSHNSASSASGNRLGCPNAAALTVRQGGGVMLVYAPSISAAAPWRVTSP